MNVLEIAERLEKISYLLSQTRTGPAKNIFDAAMAADDAVTALIQDIQAGLDAQAPKIADLDEQDQIMLDAAHWEEMNEGQI